MDKALQDRMMALLSPDGRGALPGSLRVCLDMYRLFGHEALTLMETHDVRGQDIWRGYHFFSEDNYNLFMLNLIFPEKMLSYLESDPECRRFKQK